MFESFECAKCRKVRGLAETMFNISEEDAPDGRRLILCRRDAETAGKAGVLVYRLSDTLRQDARTAQRRADMKFFEAYRGRKATEKARLRPAIRIR